MALVDWIIAAVVLLCVWGAARKGFFVEAFSLAGIVLGLLLASWNYTRALPYFTGWLGSRAIAEAAAFLVIAVGVMLIAGIIGRVIRWSVKSVGLGWADRLLGAGFGLVKGCVLVTLAVMAIAAFLPASPWLRESRLSPYFLAAARQSSIVTPQSLGVKIRQGVAIIHEHQPAWLRAGGGKS